MSPSPRIIAHLDMDAFFAAIEERNNPQFAGQPIVVGADPKNGTGRGVVSTANYAARAYGIYSALPIRTAWLRAQAAHQKGLPHTIFLPGSFREYSRVSHRIMEHIANVSPVIQKRSVDEAYFDLSYCNTYLQAKSLCQTLKHTIYTQEKLTASIGIGPNKLIAKIASDHEKPDGLTVVTPENVTEFLAPLPIRTLPGIGPKTAAKLNRLNLHYLRDVQHASLTQLKDLLGIHGESIYRKAQGTDESPLTTAAPVKSIGHHHTFPYDTHNPLELFPELRHTVNHLLTRLANENFTGARTVALTVRFANFTTHSRQHTYAEPITTADTLYRRALQLTLPFLDHRENPDHQPIRLLGLRLEKLIPAHSTSPSPAASTQNSRSSFPLLG